jgi:hypothetical protein
MMDEKQGQKALSGREWVARLIEDPSLADRCDWSKFYGRDWAELLSAQPQFADKCDWKNLDGDNWARLLAAQPQFADKCDWTKFREYCRAKLKNRNWNS